jgi:uncharacterized surface protein with fasciclin (FAS1) repeats
MRSSLLAATFAASTTAQNLIDALSRDADLSTLFQTVQGIPGLAEALNSSSDITIFAPTNDAFEILLGNDTNAENLALQTNDINGTTNLLSYHVARAAVPSAAIGTTPTYVQTLFTDELTVFGNARTNVTGGQNVGVVNNGTNVQVLSGDLQISTVVEAVRLHSGLQYSIRS